ncbi:MAG: hypothetical protein ACRC4M_00705 [Mycoplasma sp.]
MNIQDTPPIPICKIKEEVFYLANPFSTIQPHMNFSKILTHLFDGKQSFWNKFLNDEIEWFSSKEKIKNQINKIGLNIIPNILSKKLFSMKVVDNSIFKLDSFFFEKNINNFIPLFFEKDIIFLKSLNDKKINTEQVQLILKIKENFTKYVSNNLNKNQLSKKEINKFFYNTFEKQTIVPKISKQIKINYSFKLKSKQITYNEREKSVIKRLEETHKLLIQNNLIPIIIWPHGSFNYNLDTIDSDIDLEAIVVNKDFFSPLKESDALTIKISSNSLMEDQKEFLTYKNFENFKFETNLNNEEMLFTKIYSTCSSMEYFCEEIRNQLKTNSNNSIIEKKLISYINNKIKNMKNGFSTRKHLIEQFGYDPKQLHHMYRGFYQLALLSNRFQTPFDKIKGQEDNLFFIENEKIKDFLLNIKIGNIKVDIDKILEEVKQYQLDNEKLIISFPLVQKELNCIKELKEIQTQLQLQTFIEKNHKKIKRKIIQWNKK